MVTKIKVLGAVRRWEYQLGGVPAVAWRGRADGLGCRPCWVCWGAIATGVDACQLANGDAVHASCFDAVQAAVSRG